VARRALHFAPGETANLLRGRLGKALMDRSPATYGRLFAPFSTEGPSGLRDLPRPFVFRTHRLDGVKFAAGEPFEFGVNLFDTRTATIDSVREALCAGVDGQFTGVDGAELLRLPLAPCANPVTRVRVRFLTATELKGAAEPSFGVLFARIRDRVSTLRALYGDGPLNIDFKDMGRRAECIYMRRCELRQVGAERMSRRTGQRHSLGGFVGFAEYEGDLAEFTPYLEAARFTGVGRQTVWGKGEIAWEEI
jgi:hypothetical protein